MMQDRVRALISGAKKRIMSCDLSEHSKRILMDALDGKYNMPSPTSEQQPQKTKEDLEKLEQAAKTMEQAAQNRSCLRC